MNLVKIIRFFAIPIIIGSFGISTAHAQQTIFNVPSADVTDRGHLYLEHESQFGPGYWYGSHFAAYGIGNNTDINVSFYNLSSPRSGNMALGTGFKKAFPFADKQAKAYSLQYTLGAQLLTSFDNQGEGYWAYSHLSGKVPVWNTRLTAGISSGTHQLFGTNTTHFIGGIEQPVTSYLSVISDWYSGHHSLGFWTTGIEVATSKSTTLYAGYQIPNDSAVAGKAGFTFEISYIK